MFQSSWVFQAPPSVFFRSTAAVLVYSWNLRADMRVLSCFYLVLFLFGWSTGRRRLAIPLVSQPRTSFTRFARATANFRVSVQEIPVWLLTHGPGISAVPQREHGKS